MDVSDAPPLQEKNREGPRRSSRKKKATKLANISDGDLGKSKHDVKSRSMNAKRKAEIKLALKHEQLLKQTAILLKAREDRPPIFKTQSSIPQIIPLKSPAKIPPEIDIRISRKLEELNCWEIIIN